MSFLEFIEKENKFHFLLDFPNFLFLLLFSFHATTPQGENNSIKWVNFKIQLSVINNNQKMKTLSTFLCLNLD